MTSPSAQDVAATEAPTLSLTSLPTPLSHRILLLLEVDERARASCVSPAWRDLLADPALWTRLDLIKLQERCFKRSRSIDLSHEFSNSILLGATRRARGELCRLEIFQGSFNCLSPVPLLLEVLAANAGSLRELQISRLDLPHAMMLDHFFNAALETLVAAAPLLELFEIKLVGRAGCEVAPRLMRAEPPFPVPVRLHGLEVDLQGRPDMQPLAAALADAELQPTLAALTFNSYDCRRTRAAQDILVDALLLRRALRSLTIVGRAPSAASMARLLAGGTLTHLDFVEIVGSQPVFKNAAGAALVADALRANTTLTSLLLWGDDVGTEAELTTVLGALVGHRSLRKLQVCSAHWNKVCSAIAAIVAADAPALESLDLSETTLFYNGGLSIILDALPLNHHLRYLDISNSLMKEEFATEQLLPAIRANTGLRKLKCHVTDWRYSKEFSRWPAQFEAEELVQSRR